MKRAHDLCHIAHPGELERMPRIYGTLVVDERQTSLSKLLELQKCNSFQKKGLYAYECSTLRSRYRDSGRNSRQSATKRQGQQAV